MSLENIENKNNNPIYYHREYRNDLGKKCDKSAEEPDWIDTCKRVAIVSLPFFSLYRPLSFHLSLTMGTLRVVICLTELLDNFSDKNPKQISYLMLQTSVAIAGLVCTIVAHPLGMLITTGHDLIIEATQLFINLREKEYKKAMENCFNIINNSLYLAVLIQGGLEIAIASFAMQILIGLYHSQENFRNKEFIEGFGHLILSMVRMNQLSMQINMLQVRNDLEKQIKEQKASNNPAAIASNSVGELGKKWQFPSDHLPVGARIGNATVISWNILNKNYISWVYQNSQGLKGSMITDLDKPSLKNPKLTLREELIIEYILQIINDPRNGKLILSLQECHPDFVSALVKALPSHMGVVLSDPALKSRDHNITIYNKNAFEYLENESSIAKAFPISDPRRSLMDLTFKEIETNQKFQVINVHIPGDPALPGANEFAKYVLSHSKQDCITIGLGDMNFDEKRMQAAFNEEAQKMNIKSTFFNLPKYNTNVEPYTFNAKSIDHIWISKKTFNLPCKSMSPDEVLSDLQSTVDLLHPKKELQIHHELISEKVRDSMNYDYLKNYYRKKDLTQQSISQVEAFEMVS